MNGGPVDETIKDASTVILLRDTPAGIETFMLCRHHQSGFMGGAHVFPGGKVDAEDSAPGWKSRINRSPQEIATLLGEKDPLLGMGLLVAGVRETFEEAGVLLARAGADANLDQLRIRLHRGAGFLSLAEEIDLRIDALTLAPYARWVTPKMESRRFDTRFYIAVLPEEQSASHDGSETTSAVWLRPAEAIDGMMTGQIKLAPPTVRTLSWLADFHEASSVIEDALSRKPPLVRPRIVAGDRGWLLALPGDREHPEDQPALPGATRMVLQGSAWVDAI